MLQTEIMTELAQVSRTAMVFYEEAQAAANDPALRALYSRMAEHKRRITLALVARLPGGTHALPFQGTLVSAVRPVYADMLAKQGKMQSGQHTQLLAGLEARLLEHYDHATARLEQYESRHWLRSFLPASETLLAEMRTLGAEQSGLGDRSAGRSKFGVDQVA